MKYIKAQLIRLADNSLRLIPLEKVKNGFFDFSKRDENCEFIKINPPQVNLWVYKSYNGINTMGDEDHTACPVTEEELLKILENNQGVCYIQAGDDNALSCPRNGQGYSSILIHLSVPESVQKYSEKFIF